MTTRLPTHLFTITQWLPVHGLESTDYPKVHAHLQRMFERSAVRAALEAEAGSPKTERGGRDD